MGELDVGRAPWDGKVDGMIRVEEKARLKLNHVYCPVLDSGGEADIYSCKIARDRRLISCVNV
jgi:hypothetical protein